MNRMWEIRESYDKRYGMRSAEEKAYECGFDDGYEKAMREMGYSYGERKSGMRR